MTHLTHDELRRWRDNPTSEMRERVVAHFAGCEACCGAYAELMRTRAADAEPTLDPASFRQRGYHVRTAGAGRHVWQAPWVKPAAALAASIVLVIAVWTLQPDSDDAVTRGAAIRIELLNPANDAVVDASVSFEWRAEASSGCRLRVYDADKPEAPLIDRTASSGARLESGDAARFISGVTYRWFVECRGSGGDMTTSPAGRFRWQ